MALKGLFPSFEERHADKMIRPEVLALVRRGNVTLEEWKEFRGNSFEFHLMYPVLNDEAFTYAFGYNLKNTSRADTRDGVFSTYDDALKGFFAPEILKRWNALRAREVAARSVIEAVERFISKCPSSVPEYLEDAMRVYREAK